MLSVVSLTSQHTIFNPGIHLYVECGQKAKEEDAQA